jgi:hypothetical protein
MDTQAENTAPVETTQVDSEVVATPGEDSAPSGTEAAASGDDRSNWTEKAQKRYDELTEARYREAARADREAYRREQLERELQQLREAPAKTQTVAPSDDFPTLESVDFDVAKHAEAVANWSRKQASESARQALAEEREAAQREQSARDWQRKQDAFAAKNPDYVQKVVEAGRRGDWACSDAMAEVIQQSDMGPEVTTYLAENAAKSFEIARLPPALQAREIGRIEARLEAAKAAPPPVSKAPPPPGKIEGDAPKNSWNTTDPSGDSASDDEWFKAEKRRLSRKKG